MTELLEQIARVLEPQAWAALGMCDTLAYKNRRESSLRKADRVIAATQAAPIADAEVEAVARAIYLTPDYTGSPAVGEPEWDDVDSRICRNLARAAIVAYRAMLGRKL